MVNKLAAKGSLLLIVYCLFINLLQAESEWLSTHTIHITINPDSSYLEAEDAFSYNKVFKQKSVVLLGNLKIHEMSHSHGDYEFILEPDGEHHTKVTIVNKNETTHEPPEFVFKYSGKVYHEASKTSLTQRHARSYGMISDEENKGIYLPGSAFYPVAEDEMAMFNITINVPEDYTIIASGQKIKNINEERAVFRYITEFPIQHMTLVGGRYVKEAKMHDNVEFAIYTYAENPHSMQYLDASIEYYKLYTGLFGDYPYSSFRIVENFFDTGLGMPGYTLLTGRLLQMPWVTLSPGSLAHEFVHNWWGNSVFVDYEQGNWCEALTTFSTNYYYNVLTENPDGALDWRKKALIAISDLPKDKQYPVSSFKWQEDVYDAVIGYQKGAFALLEIYNFMGKPTFFNTLKQFAVNFKGKKAGWKDVIDAFNAQSTGSKYSIDIDKLAARLIDSISIPQIWLTDAQFNKEAMHLELQIKQQNDSFVLLPVEYVRDDNHVLTEHILKDKSQKLIIDTDFVPDHVRIDPNYEVLRVLNTWEKPYTLYRTLHADPILILPDPHTAEYNLAQQLKNMLAESGYSFREFTASEVTEEILHNHSIIVIGNMESNEVFGQVVQNTPPKLHLDDYFIHFDEKNYPLSTHLIQFSSDHPSNKERYCTSIYFKDLTDATQLRRFFHYQHVSLVLLSSQRAGRPVAQDEIMPSGFDTNQLRRSF